VTPPATPSTAIGVATRDARCARRVTRDANANVWRAHGIDVGADDGTDARIRDVNVETKKNAFFL